MGLIKDILYDKHKNCQIYLAKSIIKTEINCRQEKKDLSGGVDVVCDILKRFIKYVDTPFNYVGIFITQPLYAAATALGCIKNESPFIFLDVEAGGDQNQYIIKKLNVSALLTLSQDSDRILKSLKTPLFLLEFDLWDYQLQVWKSGETIQKEPLQKHILYAAQTSGSTGQPKIIQVPEEAILPNITDLRLRWDVTEKDVILLASPSTFDPFFVELFLAVTTGACLLTVPSEVRASPSCLLDSVFPSHCSPIVTIAQITPSVFTRWTPEQIQSRVLTPASSLRVLALGGEKFPPADFWERCQAPGNMTKIFSLYGITEVSCWAMISQGDSLGSPLSETLLTLSPDANNGTGELLLGSETRICLVGDESWEGIKRPLFRATGDIVNVQNGVYQYVGRKDNMCKRWGYRVSLDQVECLAASCPEVAEACCVLHRGVLCLFISLCANSPNNDSVREKIKTLLLSRLNKASVPDLIVQQGSLPLSRHGKVNRNKLKQILSTLTDEDLTCNSPKRLFQSLWKKYTTIIPEENAGFLSMGGNSVTAMIIINKMSELSKDLPTTVLTEMLNNASLIKCCDLITDSYNSEQDNTILNKKETSETIEPMTKKIKTVLQDDILYVQKKGHTLTANKANNIFSDKLELTAKWFHNLGKCVDSSPTCITYNSGKNVVVIGSHSGKLISLDLSNGTELWCAQFPDRIESSLTPSLCGTLGLIGCYDGFVYCIRLNCGTVCWSFKTGAIVKCIPLQIESTWIFGSYDYFIYCLKCINGELVWKQKLGGIVLTSPLNVPEIGLIVVTSLTGQVGTLSCETGSVQWLISIPSPIFSTPSMCADLTLVAEVDGILHALQPLSGKEAWNFKAEGKIFSSLSVLENRVLFGCHDNCIYCIGCSNDTRELLWKVDLGSPIYPTPCWISTNHICAASTAGFLFILSVARGSILAQLCLAGPIFSSPVYINQSVVVGCRDDNVYCLSLQTL